MKSEIKNSTDILGETALINVLANEELIGSKINALLTRTSPRDLYDTYSLFKLGLITNKILIKKIAIFYVCLGCDIPINFEEILNKALHKIQSLNSQKVKEKLMPMLNKGIKFDVNEATSFVFTAIKALFILYSNDIEFINNFNSKSFIPDILFKGYQTEDVSKHPMVLWKTK